MHKEVMDRILEALEKKNLSQKEISVEFKQIPDSNFSGKIAFVDGGQAEILKAVDFSLQFIRVAGLTFQHTKKIGSKVYEFYVLISTIEKSEGLYFQTEFFPISGEVIDFPIIDSLDQSLRKGSERIEISEVGGVIRRFSELHLAESLIEDLDDEDILILDGNLKSVVKGEDEYVHSLMKKSFEHKIILGGLLKTSRLFMEGGCVISALHSQGGKDKWYCELKDRALVKFHSMSEYVFEFQIAQSEKLKHVLGVLASYSKDSVFPGYPYGLLLVDQVARISNEERNYLLNTFEGRAGKAWLRVKMAVNALNSHEKLDKVS